MSFEFMTANRIIFGEGVVQQLAEVVMPYGRHIFVVTGSNPQRVQPIINRLIAAHLQCTLFSIAGEPTVERVLEGLDLLKANACEVVVAIGGGSALDAGKALATLATNEGDPFDYLEVIGKGQAITQTPLPFVAIPTTAGTGSEVTRNAVLSSKQHQTKVSMRSPLMLPTVALIDPELTYDLPTPMTAFTGMDALTQLIEPYTTPFANPLTDTLCIEGIQRAGRSLLQACQQPHDVVARHDMALASMLGGLALSNARLGAVHGFANPIGGMFDAPHGAICAILLPEVMAMNIQKMRTAHDERVTRYDRVAQLLTQRANALAEEGVAWVKNLVGALAIPRLGMYGITEHALPAIVEKSAKASSMKGNAVALSQDEMREILHKCL